MHKIVFTSNSDVISQLPQIKTADPVPSTAPHVMYRFLHSQSGCYYSQCGIHESSKRQCVRRFVGDRLVNIASIGKMGSAVKGTVAAAAIVLIFYTKIHDEGDKHC